MYLHKHSIASVPWTDHSQSRLQTLSPDFPDVNISEIQNKIPRPEANRHRFLQGCSLSVRTQTKITILFFPVPK